MLQGTIRQWSRKMKNVMRKTSNLLLFDKVGREPEEPRKATEMHACKWKLYS